MTAWLPSVRLATTENLDDDGGAPASPLTPATLDGVTVTLGSDHILVKDQTNPVLNGTWIAAAIALDPMTRRGDTFEPESTVRVSEGDRNAHTAWTLRAPASAITPDVDPLPWLRQDVRHYSVDTLADLKTLRDVLEGSTATAAGCSAPGDRGGGDFTFLGVPTFAQVASATPVALDVLNVTVAAEIVTVQTDAHGLAVGTTIGIYFDGGMTPTGAWLATATGTDTFALNRVYDGTFAMGSTASYVAVVTTAAHQRVPGQRVAVSGVIASGGAPGIDGAWDLCGVIDDVTLTLPVLTDGTGMYTPGTNAVSGDDAIAVPATDPTGTMGGLWRRTVRDPIDVRWFGAVGDWDPANELAPATDDLPAFDAAIAALGFGTPVPNTTCGTVVADGFFFLGRTLHVPGR